MYVDCISIKLGKNKPKYPYIGKDRLNFSVVISSYNLSCSTQQKFILFTCLVGREGATQSLGDTGWHSLHLYLRYQNQHGRANCALIFEASAHKRYNHYSHNHYWPKQVIGLCLTSKEAGKCRQPKTFVKQNCNNLSGSKSKSIDNVK